MTGTFRTLNERIAAIAIAVAFVLGPVAPAWAASASPARDTLTRQKVSTAANHEIRFKTPSGADSPADTITVSLPGFTFGSVAVGDIDLSHGTTTGEEVSDTLAASPGAGVWGVGISGTTITFTAPTNAAAGTIPVNNFVLIRIGTNATGGVNQLTNPSTTGSKQITIAGTFGDGIVIGVAIVSSDSVSVTATVTASSTGGGGGGSQGGGGGGGPTYNPPVISNIQITGITQTAATITWTTDVTSDSSVMYGHTNAYASGTVSDASQVTSHSIALTGLLPHSLYHFKVSSTSNVSFLTSSSADVTFSTLGDITPPVISNVQVTNITDTSAMVSWTTDEPATSLVAYGLTPSYGSYASVPGLVTNRTITLTGLTPSTTYHFVVASVDEEGNGATSTDANFITLPDTTPPSNVTNLSANPGNTQITLTWTNPTDADFAGIRIQHKIGGFPTGPTDGTTVYQNVPVTTFTDTGLTNGTMYYYGVYAYDTATNYSSGALVNATPVGPPPTPPTSTPPTSTPPTPPPTPPPTSTPPTPPPTPPEVPPPTPPETLPPAPQAPPVVLPPGTVAPPGVVTATSVPAVKGEVQAQFATASGIPLVSDTASRIGVIRGSTIQVSVPLAGIGATTKAAFIAIDGSLFSLQLNKDATSYTGSFTVPSKDQSSATVSVQLEDGSYLAKEYTLLAQPGIRVVEQTITGLLGNAVPGAKVSMFRQVNGSWQAYGTAQETNGDGVVAVYAPNGRYYVEVSAGDAAKVVSDPFEVSMNVLNAVVKIISIPKRIPPPPEASTVEKATYVAQVAADRAVYVAQVARTVLDQPVVQKANAVAAPIALTVSIVNAASSLSLFNAFAFAQNLFTQPLLLLGRKKRKRWGVVYNSLSKLPVELAIVRLVHFETKLVVQSRVTDKQGRYWFQARKGNYQIEVVKPGYVFPSQYLSTQTEDVELVDLYHADKIELPEDSIIARNIPIDPAFSEETPKQVLFKSVFQKLKFGLAFGGIILGVVILIVSPTVPSALLLVAQVAAYLLFKRLGVPAKAKNWGLAFDAKTRKPLTRVIVRIFDKKYNKLLETQVTDQNGKYGFFVKENVYYITAEKAGYKRFTSPDIDLRGKKETVINQHLSLEPADSSSAPSLMPPKPPAPPPVSTMIQPDAPPVMPPVMPSPPAPSPTPPSPPTPPTAPNTPASPVPPAPPTTPPPAAM